MRFLILNSDYQELLTWFYSQHPDLYNISFSKQKSIFDEKYLNVSKFYVDNLRILGHEAWYLAVNNEIMQIAWANEYGFEYKVISELNKVYWEAKKHLRGIFSKLKVHQLKEYIRSVFWRIDKPSWFYDIIRAQIDYYKPDILLIQDILCVDNEFLIGLKKNIKMIIGQHAATYLPNNAQYSAYDLIISSYIPTVNFFKQKGIPSTQINLAFEPALLELLDTNKKEYDITFIGSFWKFHQSRIKLLEFLCSNFSNIGIWGVGIENVDGKSQIRDRYNGVAWGLDMYQIMRNSKILVNHHGDIPLYANNLRLFEATGVGSLLITDWKPNLGTLFEMDNEVVSYNDYDELIKKVEYYSKDEDQRNAIATAGQKRTMIDHTYKNRIEKLLKVIQSRTN